MYYLVNLNKINKFIDEEKNNINKNDKCIWQMLNDNKLIINK